jgi:hypothetical protein
LKPRYFDEPDKDKKDRFKLQIEDTIHELTNGKEAFDFEIYFSEVFHRKSGFDVIIANPPYIGEKGHKELFSEIKKGTLRGVLWPSSRSPPALSVSPRFLTEPRATNHVGRQPPQKVFRGVAHHYPPWFILSKYHSTNCVLSLEQVVGSTLGMAPVSFIELSLIASPVILKASAPQRVEKA